MFRFNPDLAEFKSGRGAIDEEDKLYITVVADVKKVDFLIASDGGGYDCYSMIRDRSKGSFFVRLEPLKPGLYFYHFECDDGLYAASDDLWAVKSSYGNYRDWQLTVTAKDYQTPDFLKGAVFYQIFPDRFMRAGDAKIEKGKILVKDWGKTPTYRNADGDVLNNEFFGGDFKGILSKLYYLKELGVTAVYLNPICKAYSSHRYDTGDYLKVDPLLGTEADLKTLIAAAGKIGISFIFDGVYNHTGADSLYFNKFKNYPGQGAYNSKKSCYYRWYEFRNYPDSYASWWDFETLPSIRKDSEEFQSFIVNKVLPHYFRLGFKGVRLDVVDELTDSFVEKIRSVAKVYGAAVIGEVWEDATNKIAYGVRRKYFLGNELDSVMNYPLKDGICDFLLNRKTDYFVNVILTQINNFPRCALNSLFNVLSTHDTVRIINCLGRKKVVTDKDELKNVFLDDEELNKGKNLAKIAYALLYTVYGSPSVYYGDEAGLTGDLDPYNRRCYPWGREDHNLIAYFKRLASVRKKSVFVDGEFNFLYYDKKIVVYERCDGAARIVVAASMNETACKLRFSTNFVNLMSDDKSPSEVFVLEPESVLILEQIVG